MRRVPLAKWACLTAVITAGLIAVASSSAHTESYESKITIKHEEGTAKYSGRVISALGSCEKNRTVKLYTSAGKEIAETTTSNKGRWKYEFVGQRYYARVLKRVDGSGQHEHVCRADRSPTTTT
jgi:hypothetical protein